MNITTFTPISVEAGDIADKHICRGTRVSVHPLELPGVSDQVVRIPKDRSRDSSEVREVGLLAEYFRKFMPNPGRLITIIRGEMRELIFCDRVYSSYLTSEPSAGIFSSHLASLPTIDQKILFLRQLREFVERCKLFFAKEKRLPDLVGKGNFVPHEETVYLLDLNNAVFGTINGEEEITVPVDEAGWPIFDMSLRLLYGIERHLLTHCGGNFSSQHFNRNYRHTRIYRGSDVPDELTDILHSRETLKEDSFYGALRFSKRRIEVEKIITRLQSRGCAI